MSPLDIQEARRPVTIELFYDPRTGHAWPHELGPLDPRPTRAEVERAHTEALAEATLRIAAVAW